MSQRNPLNERYNEDREHKGVTRKSAGSAKPKAKAAASVRIESKTKTPEERKAAQKAKRKAERATNNANDRKYANPPTQRYKNLRRIWWVCIALAIAFTLASWFGRQYMPEALSVVVLFVAYGLIFAAFYIDLGLIRKERRRYAAEVEASKTKEQRRAEKKAKAEALKEAKRKAEAEANGEAAEEEKEAPKRSLFKGGFKKTKSDAKETAEAVKGELSGADKTEDKKSEEAK